VLLAELEVFHSRAFSPTRRLALGRMHLPVDPAPGFGPLLLGGVVAIGAEELDEDDHDALLHLMDQLEHGQRVVQPRLRNRYQVDHQGLARTVGSLVAEGEQIDFDFDGNASPLQMALGATYAAGRFPREARPRAFAVLRGALRWRGPIDHRLLTYLSGRDGTPSAFAAMAFGDPTSWARDVLGLDGGREPGKKEIQRRFRHLLREAHPDHGADSAEAAARIAELSEARRILLG
jgi:hypothetical protein